MSRFLRRDIYAVTGPVEMPSVTEPGEGPAAPPPPPPRGRSGSATGHDKILMSPLIANVFLAPPGSTLSGYKKSWQHCFSYVVASKAVKKEGYSISMSKTK